MREKTYTAVILAAGKGTRMKSPLPKVLHPVAGVPMIVRVVDAARKSQAEEVRVVVGYQSELVRRVLEPLGAMTFVQEKQWGTADAVRAAEPENLEGTVVILNGDHPLLTQSHLEQILTEFRNSSWDLAVVSAEVQDPGQFGRIVRHKGELQAIVEAKDASADTLDIREVNTGIYVVQAELLNQVLPRIESQNVQGEFYLTDLIEIARQEQKSIGVIQGDKDVSFGVNSQEQLAGATAEVFQRKIKELMDDGVVVIDPNCTYVEDQVSVASGSVLYPGVYLKGKTHIGSYCVIEPNCMITDCRIADSVQIKAGCYLEQAKVGTKSVVGPYAHVRPDSEIGEECKVGNFVELKKTRLGKGTKASHLTYLGDAEVGENTNIGCGTITCNYAADHKKYRTRIGDNVFVGSDSQFVAPVEVGNGALIGSGSTITKDVPADALSVGRAKQVIKEGYAKRFRQDKGEG